MPILKVPEKKNLWESICSEFERKKLGTIDDNKNEDIDEFDASKHNPVFYGQAFKANTFDDKNLLENFDPSMSHPACVGYFIEPYVKQVGVKKSPRPALNINKCTKREYLEEYVFPLLMPALEGVLNAAKNNKCFERKRTAFNACDFITEYLYNKNSKRTQFKEKHVEFLEIPFVKDSLAVNPRKPLPKSLVWTEEEATLKLQAFYRGYQVRCDPEVQELRKWQKELREENQNITQRVEKFWDESTTPKPLLESGNTMVSIGNISNRN